MDVPFKPTYSKVVLQIEKEKEVTKGGIVIPSMAKVKPITAKVVAVGPGRYENGTFIPTCVKVGDRVVFSKMIGMPFKYNGQDYIVVPDVEIVLNIDEGVEIEATTIFD